MIEAINTAGYTKSGSAPAIKATVILVRIGSPLKQHPLHRPIQPHRRDEAGGGDDDSLAVPGLAAEGQAHEEEGDGEDGQQSSFDSQVEGEEGGEAVGLGEAELRQDSREAQAVQEAEGEDGEEAPGLQIW